MSQFQAPISIRDALEKIRRNELAMPAIQRDYEWDPGRIAWLFDSLMREYPVSSFLLWEVRGENIQNYKFYSFLREYRETFKIRGEERSVANGDRFLAVLDGQQRLTSLNIGFRGSYAWRVHYGRLNEDNETSRPTRKLYLNLTHRLDPEDDEQGRVYEFEFKTEDESGGADLYSDAATGYKWFRIGKILDLMDHRPERMFLETHPLTDDERDVFDTLKDMLDRRTINYYLEEDPDLQKALNIFIRINSGGATLSISTILFSIAISVWRTDAKRAFDQLRTAVANLGYEINNDFILKAFLYVHSSDIKFKVTNFANETAELLERNWESLSNSIIETFRTINRFGYCTASLPAKNVLMPIIYYIYYRGVWRDFSVRMCFEGDREVIRKWLHQAVLHRIVSGSSDTVLMKVRRAFTEDLSQPLSKSGDAFPADDIRHLMGSRMAVSEEFLEYIVHLQKDHALTFAALALLFPQLDYRNTFHKDHMHPECGFQHPDLSQIGEADRIYFEDAQWWNAIVNLQMLDHIDNESKNGGALASWVEHEVNDLHKNEDQLRQRCIIPQGVSLEFADFPTFVRARKEILKDRHRAALA